MLSLSNDLIVIPAKGISVRCPKKNEILLPFISRYLGDNLSRSVLVSDCDDLTEYGESLGLNTFKSNITTSELSAIYDYLENINYSRESFIYLPLTQPLREIGLIEKLDKVCFDFGIDFITSKNKYCDRKLFQIDNNSFVTISNERKGCMCKNIEHLDGAIYKVRYDFLRRVVSNNNPNSAFWLGKFYTVDNNLPFLDIDEIFDLDKFLNLIELINLIKG